MKKIIKLIACFMAIMAISSCNLFDDNNSSKGTKEIQKIVGFPDSVRKKIVEQDSLMTELLNKVDTLTAALNFTKSEIAELRNKVEESQKPKNIWTYVSIGAFVLGMIALIVALAKSKGIKKKKVYDIVKQCIDDSRRIKELQEQVHSLLLQRKSRSTQPISLQSSNSDDRIRKLESQMAQILTNVNLKKTPVTDTFKTSGEREQRKVGYARIDSENYFTTIYESNQEGCAFKITFKNEKQGEFTIISLDRISSSNDWQKKVECNGVSIKEASDFRVEELGVCKNIGHNTWEVTKPLKIKLLK